MNIYPIYDGKRVFLGLKDLVVSFYTKKCQFDCLYCDIPSNSSRVDVTPVEIIKQIDWVFDKYKSEIAEFRQLSVGNEGSILDEERFPREVLEHLLEQAKSIENLEVLSLETRPEYINTGNIERILKKTHAGKLDVTVGFETQDDTLRNMILNKKIRRTLFENKVRILGELGVRLTTYIMLKPGYYMTEEEGISEACATVDYLNGLCCKTNTELVIYLNPTYIAKGSKISRLMRESGYEPPKLQSAVEVVMHATGYGIPVYTGLWNEGLSDLNGDYKSRKDYYPGLYKLIKEFNKSQDKSLFEMVSQGVQAINPDFSSNHIISNLYEDGLKTAEGECTYE